ncbi:HAD family hydrolase [Gordonibacter sp.]|uniref:HAD family hydrolase n=2 Tax=Gordonibacter sp. TaxID=1968902 RepID=UPI002FC81D2C
METEHANPFAHNDASSRAVDAVVFDLDGTLLDTLPDLVVLTNAVLRECDFPERTSDEILSFVGNGVRALMYQAVPDDSDEVAVEEAMQRWKEQYPYYGHKLTEPYPGIPEILDELKGRGVKLGVLSNKFDAGVQDVVGAYLPDLFGAIHGECAEIPRKPDPAGLLRTIRELGTVPERTIYVGDSPGDIAASRNAGVLAVGVSWGYHDAEHLHAANPDWIISDPYALLDLVQQTAMLS